MATYTTYKKLEKPLSTEKYNVGVANKNNDVIDSELHKLELKNESQDNLLATKEALNSEISRAENKENEIAKNLSDEINRATISENSINENLSLLISDLTTITENKVDKISGKGLSTNDYSTAEKNKLESIAPGAQINVQSDWEEADSNSDSFIKNKPTIPTKISQLINDNDYQITDTWKANTKDNEGYVLAGDGHINQVWKTDENGIPGWRNDNASAISLTNNLLATVDGTALDAMQGKILDDKITGLNNKLTEQPEFIYDANGKITGYKTKGGADAVFPFNHGLKLQVKRLANTSDGSVVSAITTVDVTDYSTLIWKIAYGGSDERSSFYLINPNGSTTTIANSPKTGASGNYNISHISGSLGIACQTYKTTLAADITIK